MSLALTLLAAAALSAEAPSPVEPAAPAPEPAAAAEPAPAATNSETAEAAPIALAALKAGGLFPQVMSRLSTSFVIAVEGAWVTPLFGHKLAVGLELAFGQPPHARTVEDPRVPSGAYSYTVMERTLGLYVGPKYFFLPPGGRMVPWVGLGLRAQFVDSQLVGTAGEAFGQHDETGTHLAFGGQAGFGHRLGPGLVALELQLISSPLDHLVTGAVNIGDLALRAAYVLTF